MLKVKEGQLETLGLLFERYKKVLFGFFYNMNFDQELSEDLVQNVFERILKYRKGFKGDGEFKVWMFHIARNVNIDHYRKVSRFKNEELHSHRETLGNNNLNQEEVIGKREELELLRTALNRLDREKREVLTLSKIEEMKYKQIGEVLNCSEGAVKVKVFRAMQSLKDEFIKIKKLV